MATFRVKDVYDGNCVFLTGGTGFLGKVMIEKMLWALDGIDKIYLLIRARKGSEPAERLRGLIHDPLFARLHSEKPDVFNKLVAVNGDMMLENFGFSEEDHQEIINKVSVVIHSAATVKFDDHIRTAVTMNLIGTKRIIALCHEIKALKVLVHVSTAYANCDRVETTEKIYKSPVPPEKLIDALSWMDDDTLTKITPKILGLRPNTYTLTKALAESTIEEEAKDIPVIVIRPSIVGAMWKGPLPGWTDNINGPTGIFAAVGGAVLTNMCGSSESKADIIPVDIVANMIIAAASYRASIQPNRIPVIHCSSGELNPLLWGHIVVFLDAFYRKYPMNKSIGVPSTYFHKTRAFFIMNYYLRHHIPAMAMDWYCRLRGRKSSPLIRYARMYEKAWKMTDTLHFFTTRGWNFHANGMPELYGKMTQEDQKNFNFDVRQVDWDSYLFDYVMGIKKFINKENVEDTRFAKNQLLWFRFRRQALASILYAIVIFYGGRKWKRSTRYMSWLMTVAISTLYAENSYRKRVPLKSLDDYLQTSNYSNYLQ
uniref:Fatty acyl-CoA reductase n=1 Tax=Caenorhabditis tropicalis TaxID=1561998 RepID=A0A1I7TCX4_9PELO